MASWLTSYLQSHLHTRQWMSIFFVCGACALQARGDLRRLERFWSSTIHNSEMWNYIRDSSKKTAFFSSLTKNKTKARSKKKKKRSWFCRDTYVTTGAMRRREKRSRKAGWSGRAILCGVWSWRTTIFVSHTFFRDWIRLMWNSCTRWIRRRESWLRDRLARGFEKKF